MEALLGRKPIDEAEKRRRLSINLKQKVIDMISQDGNPKTVIEQMVLVKYNPDTNKK